MHHQRQVLRWCTAPVHHWSAIPLMIYHYSSRLEHRQWCMAENTIVKPWDSHRVSTNSGFHYYYYFWNWTCSLSFTFSSNFQLDWDNWGTWTLCIFHFMTVLATAYATGRSLPTQGPEPITVPTPLDRQLFLTPELTVSTCPQGPWEEALPGTFILETKELVVFSCWP